MWTIYFENNRSKLDNEKLALGVVERNSYYELWLFYSKSLQIMKLINLIFKIYAQRILFYANKYKSRILFLPPYFHKTVFF